MRALVTGSHGFVGTHLRRLLHEADWSVAGIGTVRREPTVRETYFLADLADESALTEALEETEPDVIFHLAARNGRGQRGIGNAVAANVGGTLHLFSALERRGRPVRVVVAGSSAQYGSAPDSGYPVQETASQLPLGAYGWSKIGAESIALAHQGCRGIEVISARPFNHTGPGEPPYLVCSSFARGIARVEAGRDDGLDVGDLETIRDFTDVRDVARAYLDLAERGTPGRIYNVCSGNATRVGDVLEMLLGQSRATVDVRADSEKATSAGLARQVGSNARIRREVGWRPQISLEGSLRDLLNGWRSRVVHMDGKS